MRAYEYDLKIEQNADFVISLNLTQNGQVFDLTNYTAKCQIRKYPSANDILFEANIEINIEAGTLLLKIPAQITQNIYCSGATYKETQKFAYDLLLTSADKTIRLLNGNVYISPATTKVVKIDG